MTVLYQDEHLLVVDKPRGVHVHPTELSPGEISVQDLLEKELGHRPHPVHRLDRPVGGVLLLTKTTEAASLLGSLLRERRGIEKHYLVLVRGWMEGWGVIEKPLRQTPGKPERDALTRWKSLAKAEAPWSDGHFPTSRYTLLECRPETGRHHQIRRHLASLSHPVMGDIRHGDNPKNRIWAQRTEIMGLMLQSHRLSFSHPATGEPLAFTAPADPLFLEAARVLGWEKVLVGG